MTTLLAPVAEQNVGPAPGIDEDVEPDAQWKEALKRRIEQGLQSMVDKVRQERDTGLRGLREGTREYEMVIRAYNTSMDRVRRIAEEQFSQELKIARFERSLALGKEVEGEEFEAFRRQQQAIWDKIKQEGSERPQGRPESSVVGRPTHENGDPVAVPRAGGELDVREGPSMLYRDSRPLARAPVPEYRPRDRTQSGGSDQVGGVPGSYGSRPPRSRGNSSVLAADFDAPQSGPSPYDQTSVGRQGLSSLSRTRPQDIWLPVQSSGSNSSATSRTLAHATAPNISPVSPNVREGPPNDAGGRTLSRAGSMRSHERPSPVSDLEPGTSFPRDRFGMGSVEERERMSSRKGKEPDRPEPQREAGAAQPTIYDYYVSRRPESRTAMPITPARPSLPTQSSDEPYFYQVHNPIPSSRPRPESEERDGIPVRAWSSRRSIPSDQGSPESPRYMHSGSASARPIPNKRSFNGEYDSWQPQPGSASRPIYGPQSPPAPYTTSNSRPIPRPPSGDDNPRRHSPSGPWHGSTSPPDAFPFAGYDLPFSSSPRHRYSNSPAGSISGRRNSNGSRSVRSRSSRQEFWGPSDVSQRPLATYEEQSVASDTDSEEDYGMDLDDLWRVRERQELAWKLIREQEEAKRQELLRKAEEAKRLEEEARRKEEEARRQAEEARRKEEEVRLRALEIQQKEEELRRREAELARREMEAKYAEERRKREEAEARLQEEIRRRQEAEEETRRREQDDERRRAREEKERREVEEAERRRQERDEAERRRQEREDAEKRKREREEAERRERERREREEREGREREERERREREERERRDKEEQERRERAAKEQQERERRQREEEQKAKERREWEERKRQLAAEGRAQAEARREAEQLQAEREVAERLQAEAARAAEAEARAQSQAARRQDAAPSIATAEPRIPSPDVSEEFQDPELIRQQQIILERIQIENRVREEAKRRAEETKKRAAMEEARKRAEDEARQRAEAEARSRAEAEQDGLRRELDARRRAEEEYRKKAEDAKKREDAILADVLRRSEEEHRRQEEQRKRQDSVGSSSDASRSGAYYSSASSVPRPVPTSSSIHGNASAGDRSSTASSSSHSSSSSFFSATSGRSTSTGYSSSSASRATATPIPGGAGTPTTPGVGSVPKAAWKTSAFPQPGSSPSTPSRSATGSAYRTAHVSTPSPAPSASSHGRPGASQGVPLPDPEAWTRHQQEFARQQFEQFQRDQERQNRQTQATAMKQLTKEQVIKLFEDHELRWATLANLDVLSWQLFPWPMLKQPSDPEQVTYPEVQAYVLSPHHPGDKSQKDRIKDHLRKWHPDRFETKLLPKVREDEREKVKEGAGAVARHLNKLLSSLSGSAENGLFG